MNRRSAIVEQIVSKIPSMERRDFVLTKQLDEKIQEQLRLLETKISVGQLGKGDTLESRAAIVLEYLTRRESMHKFSPEALSAVLGMNKRVFQTLHQKVANHLPSLSNPVNTTLSTKRKAVTAKAAGNKSTRRRLRNSTAGAASLASRASSIPSISIRLGSLVHDSHGFASRAEQLMRDIEAHMSAKKSHLRREALTDLQRHHGVYEAACFYVVSTQATTHVKKGRSQSQGEGENAIEEGPLEENDVIRASNVSEQVFKDILPTVVDLAAKISGMKKDPPSNRNKKSTNNKARSRGKKQVGAKQQTHVYTETFLKWKKQVLSDTSNQTKLLLADELSKSAEDISDSQAMQRAAEDALRRHGLLADDQFGRSVSGM